MSGTVAGSEPTLLRALVKERHLTAKETVRLLGGRAQRMGEVGFALSERQLRRWLAGDVASTDGARQANVRVVEAEFGFCIEALLAPDRRPRDAQVPRLVAHEDRPLRTGAFVAWIAEHSGFSYEAAYAGVTAELDRMAMASPIARATREHSRSHVGRALLADAVGAYYGESAGFYTVRAGQAVLTLSVLVDQGSAGVAVPLGGIEESCRLVGSGAAAAVRLSDAHVRAALNRLAAAEAHDTVMVNNPLYTLAGLDLGSGRLAAEFGCTDFAAYALTADLLETELRDLLRDGRRDPRREPTPLRDAWLPSVEAGLAFAQRVCVGGPVCLLAIAEGDHYHLLVQERSTQVLNVTGTLAVIPKAFHQPTVDAYGETHVSMTLERELEEELLGRPDLEHLSVQSSRRAAPMHPLGVSEPMRWLHDHPDAWQMECTAFGINMVSGNYEFACLVVIRDETWWATYGHLLEANWETMRLQRYSTLDRDGLLRLMLDDRWSNEGLFAFVEGLRRLAELDPGRVHAPDIGCA